MDLITIGIAVCFILALSYDVHILWRYYLVLYFCKQRRKSIPRKLLEENEFKVICLTTDLDLQGNMTASRILRECSLGQLEFRIENFLLDALEACECTLKNEENHITYVQPIRLFDTFKIKAKLLYWDENNLYMEQTVVLNKDRSVRATILTRQRLANATVGEVLHHMKETVERPQLTDAVKNKITKIQNNLTTKKIS